MPHRIRFALAPLALAVAVSAALTGCDGDDPAEPALVRFAGTYVGEVDRSAFGADDEGRGVCCFTISVEIANDASGAVSGAGTITYEDPSEPTPPIAVDIAGTTEVDTVAMSITPVGDGFALAFEGTVAADGGSITGEFVSQAFGGTEITFVRAP